MSNNSTKINFFLKKFDLTRNYLKDGSIVVETNKDTYLPEGEMKHGWLFNLYTTFCSTSENASVNSMAIVGIGPGVEALLFIEKFKLKELYCFDINGGVLKAAENNIKSNLRNPESLKLVLKESDLLQEMIDQDKKVDSIYENLPNLKVGGPLTLTDGIGSASFFSEESTRDGIKVPEHIDNNMLRLHYRFLAQAKKCLNPNGKVICCLGARISINVIKAMFNELGYDFKILHIGLIQQLSAKEVIDTYRAIEENTGKKFTFLPHRDKKAMKMINDFNLNFDDPQILFEKIQGRGFSAAVANIRLINGRNIDHLGLIIEGTIKK